MRSVDADCDHRHLPAGHRYCWEANAVLFTGSTSSIGFENANIEVVSLKTGQTKVLQPGEYFGHYLAENSSAGHPVYLHESDSKPSPSIRMLRRFPPHAVKRPTQTECLCHGLI